MFMNIFCFCFYSGSLSAHHNWETNVGGTVEKSTDVTDQFVNAIMSHVLYYVDKNSDNMLASLVNHHPFT